MLVHSKLGRLLAWLLFAVLFIPVFGFPLITVLAMGFATSWNSTLPSGFTISHIWDAFSGVSASGGSGQISIVVSLETAAIATIVSLVIGASAAIGATQISSRRPRKLIDAFFLIPIAVPSVVIGLNLLLGFSRRPFHFNGSPLIVIIAHISLITAFAYQTSSAALARLDPATLQAVASLGAHPNYVLRKITLPLLTPGLIAGAGLSFALSMGELGATIMVYPAGFATQPVSIFQLTDKSANFTDGGAYAVVLMTATVVVLWLMSRIRTKAAYR